MTNFDQVNVILLTGNLIFLGALFLFTGRKAGAFRGGAQETLGADAAGAPETGEPAETMGGPGPCLGEILAGLLEFAVYGAGMIRAADLILQGIAGPGPQSRALLAVRVLLAESMLLLFPLWKTLDRWKAEEEGLEACADGGRRGSGRNLPDGAEPAAGIRQGRRPGVLEEGEGILGMLLLFGLTLQGWQEQDAVRALGRQAWLFLLFFCYGCLRRRRRLKGLRSPGGEAGGKAPQGRAEYLKNVEEQYQRTRELWHDLKNHIKVLEILAQEERFGELGDYLHSFWRDVERRMVPAGTGCAPVDALLGDKLYLAGKQGTELSLQLCGLSRSGIETVDWCVILGNLLDNALEACARLDGPGRIGLRMRREEEFYYISVVNTSGEPRRQGAGYLSAKQGRDNVAGHGLGLRSAERVAHRYGGLLAADYSHGEFRVVVRLQGACGCESPSGPSCPRP